MATDDRISVDVATWDSNIAACTPEERALLEHILAALPLTADVTRSDVLLTFPGDGYQVCIAAHAMPHSMASLYGRDPVAGDCYESSDRRWLWTAMTRGMRRQRIIPEVMEERPEVGQQVWPVLGPEGNPLAAVTINTNVIERERHRRRDSAFQKALIRYLQMMTAGEIIGTEHVPPFREQDGIIFIDHLARYRYISGQANNVYRRLGYLDDLRGRSLSEVAAGDLRIVQQAWDSQACVFREDTVRGRNLLRTAIPLLGPPELNAFQRLSPRMRAIERYGALLLLKDVTEGRLKAQELKVQAVMIKEVHHRVKNNLQMLVSIMRMQSRRAHSDEARLLLNESINRILSMSAIHESLSEGEDQVLNLREVLQRIVAQFQSGMVSPTLRVQILIPHADDVCLPTNRATACALALNELLLNAVEHGFGGAESGKIWIYLRDGDELVELEVVDDGWGLPEDFTLDSGTSLGLDIIRTLVQDDLKGKFDLIPLPEAGTRALVRFPKSASGGASYV